MEPITFGSLFAGFGGFDLGLERAGWKCRWQCEINSYATKVLAKHWPDVERYPDVRLFPPEPESVWTLHKWKAKYAVNAVVGGFPCTDISFAGRGAGITGAESGLFFEAIRVVRLLQPEIVVLENVAALLNRGMDQVIATLASIGYDAEWHCIPAAAVGAPHIRDRIFIVAYPAGSRWMSRGGISGTEEGERFGWGELIRSGQVLANPNITGSQGVREEWSSEEWEDSDRYSGSCSLVTRDFCAQWATEPAVRRMDYGIPNRLERITGLGNAIVPQVAECIGRVILEMFQQQR